MIANDTNGVGNETGAAMQYPVPSAKHQIATSIPGTSNVQSAVIPSNGWQKVAVGVTSTQAGTLTLQRYLDAAGTIPQGAAITATLTANTAATVNAIDGAPFMSFQVTVSNSSGSVATLSKIAVLQQSA